MSFLDKQTENERKLFEASGSALRIFKTSEVAKILGVSAKAINQWSVREQFTIEMEDLDGYRFSFFDLFRMGLAGELVKAYAMEIKQAFVIVEGFRDGGPKDAAFLAASPDGKQKWFRDGASLREAVEAATESASAEPSDKRQPMAIVIDIPAAFAQLEEKIKAAEEQHGRVLGSKIMVSFASGWRKGMGAPVDTESRRKQVILAAPVNEPGE